MGMFKPDLHPDLQLRRTAGLFDHFMRGYAPGATGIWNETETGGGASVSLSDSDGGVLSLATGATQNNEACLFTPLKLWTFVANKPMIAQCGFYYTEAATNAAGIVFGFASSWTNILADTTYALPTTLSGALIYKKPTETLWSAFASVGTTQSSQQSNMACQNAGNMQEFIIQVMPNANSNIEVTFWQGPLGIGASDGVVPMKPNVTSMARMQPIKFEIAYASAAAMQLGLFVKASGSNSETVHLDYIGAELLSVP